MIEITNEDNMELMARYEDNYFDLSIVDPPYRDENQPTKDMRANGSMKSLEGRPTQEYWNELFRVSKEQIIWGANNFKLPQFKGFLVWDKGIPFNFTMSMAEIASFSEGLSTISKIHKLRIAGAENRIHPTQKPVKLYEFLLMHYAKEGDKVLDTHLGSGSIAIACHNLGYSLTACELDKDYYEAAIKRLKQHQAQQTLF
jgi:site-specific DNA-methyltransferase (adenine-specific)